MSCVRISTVNVSCVDTSTHSSIWYGIPSRVDVAFEILNNNGLSITGNATLTNSEAARMHELLSDISARLEKQIIDPELQDA